MVAGDAVGPAGARHHAHRCGFGPPSSAQRATESAQLTPGHVEDFGVGMTAGAQRALLRHGGCQADAAALATAGERAAFAARYADEGLSLVKLYYETEWADLLAIADALPAGMRFAVDALWHLPPREAIAMGRTLDARNARWLECPLYPEDIEGHVDLAAAVTTPIAIGESYRTLHELRPFMGIAKVLQPDLGRCGITGSRRIAAAFAGEVVPHLSIAMGPQIAAALHFAAATENCDLCEFNPNVLDTANRFLAEPLVLAGGQYKISALPGLGIVWNKSFQTTYGPAQI